MISAISAVVLYSILATGFISVWLLGSLEKEYPQLLNVEAIRASKIVILAGYAERHPLVPLSSSVNFASAYRLIEGLSISRKIPESEIIITGHDNVPLIMSDLLVSMGYPPDRIHTDSLSSSTYESATRIVSYVGQDPFILITSAGHMPRAIGTFKKAGLNPIPDPTNYISLRPFNISRMIHSPENVYFADLALHEFIGIAWYRLTGRM